MPSQENSPEKTSSPKGNNGAFPANADPATILPDTDSSFLVVGIGASAGGIKALKEFFQHVPANTGCAYVVILHLSPEFESHLAEILQTVAAIPVAQVQEERVRVQPDHVYVIPPNKSLQITDGYLTLSPVMTYEERRAPVDIFFRTLAENRHAQAAAVILSGTGPNGSMGVKRLKEMGGVIIVQSPEEAEYSDMPRASINTGLVDYILPVQDIPAHILQYRDRLKTIRISEVPENIRDKEELEEDALRDIFTRLRTGTGHDFSAYKRATVLRRIARRMGVREVASLPAYAELMKSNPGEGAALLKDLLISVTNFFRDREVFTRIENEIIPSILNKKNGADTIRIWVAGCATGEEAYSIAMLFAEQTADMPNPPQVMIFATDLDEEAIAHAREGVYTNSDVADVSPERLQRFFTHEEGNLFRVRRELREYILFAHHNVLRDPPFSRLSMATCRNLLIYLNRSAQARVLQTIHFALQPGGYLVLGSSESVDGTGDLYVSVDRERSIYQSRAIQGRPVPPVLDLPAAYRPIVTRSAVPVLDNGRPNDKLSLATLHYQLLEHYAPPSVLINAEYDIVHLSERAGEYLQIAGGEPSYNLLKAVRPELRMELRSILYNAVQGCTLVQSPPVPIHLSRETVSVTMTARHVTDPLDPARGFLLVLFEKSGVPAETKVLKVTEGPEGMARQLEQELVSTRSQLRATTEQYEIQTEELRASNEELQAINEELRSAAEELETGKEELQSVNEELTTVNQELKFKIDELSQSNNDFQNLMGATDIGTIFLDRSFNVKLFTPAAQEIFNLLPGDFGRPLSDITNRLIETDLMADAEAVIQRLVPVEREVHTKDGMAFLMRLSPYRTDEDRISGVVATFINITRRKEAEEKLRKSEERFRLMMDSVRDYAIFTIDPERRVVTWNPGAEIIFGYTAAEITGRSADVLFVPEDLLIGAPENEARTALVEGRVADERWHLRKDGSRFYASGVMTMLRGGTLEGFVKVTRDLTEKVLTEQRLRASEERYQTFIAQTTEGIWRFEMEEGIDTSLPVEEQIGRIYQHSIVAECNNAMARMYDYDSATAMQNARMDALLPPNEENKTYLRKFIASGYRISNAESHEVDKSSKDKYFINTLVGIVEDGQLKRAWGMQQDITQRKALEKTKEDFIGIASHELRTPVASIKAYVEVLHDILTEAKDEESAGLIQKLDGQVDRLTALVKDLLDATRISEGKIVLNKEVFDINELVSQTVEELQRTTKHSLELELQPVLPISADRERIRQVFINLASNAIKYSPDGERILIRSYAKDNEVTICVQDFGIGLNEEAKAMVFERFYRARDSNISTYPGLGLGLYIATEIVQRHGGRMWIDESIKGKGSVFCFSLPLQE